MTKYVFELDNPVDTEFVYEFPDFDPQQNRQGYLSQTQTQEALKVLEQMRDEFMQNLNELLASCTQTIANFETAESLRQVYMSSWSVQFERLQRKLNREDDLNLVVPTSGPSL